jgi:hypothetical protein
MYKSHNPYRPPTSVTYYSCYVSRPILKPPPIWLQEHTDLRVQVSQTLQPSYLSHILQLLRKQTDTGTSTALTAETHWSTCTSITNLTAPLSLSHDCSFYVSRRILAHPPFWLQKQTDLRGHDFAHSPDLTHQPRLADFTCALSWRLFGINPAIPPNSDSMYFHSKLTPCFVPLF